MPLVEAVAALTPPVPADPHRLMAPDRIAAMVDGARGRALVNELYPRDDREPYAPPRIEPDHHAALARRQARHQHDHRRTRRDEERSATEDWADDPDDPDDLDE